MVRLWYVDYMGTTSFDVVLNVTKVRKAPRLVYRSPELYAKLRHEIDMDNSSSNVVLGYRCHYNAIYMD
ncbi:hypothetical protein Hanom_Chr04g00304751 [Helianthus anomalus]